MVQSIEIFPRHAGSIGLRYGHRAAEELRRAELNAQAEAEAAAVEADRVAREAERTARISERHESPVERERALREAEDAARRAAAERVGAARRAEAAAVAEASARREEREIAEAHASAQRQAASWNDSEMRRRSLAGPQPTRVPALSGDPYEVSQGSSVDGDLLTPNRQLEYTQPQRYRDETRATADERRSYRQPEPEVRRPRGYKPDQTSGMRPAVRQMAPDALPDAKPHSEGVQPRLAASGVRPPPVLRVPTGSRITSRRFLQHWITRAFRPNRKGHPRGSMPATRWRRHKRLTRRARSPSLRLIR